VDRPHDPPSVRKEAEEKRKALPSCWALSARNMRNQRTKAAAPASQANPRSKASGSTTAVKSKPRKKMRKAQESLSATALERP